MSRSDIDIPIDTENFTISEHLAGFHPEVQSDCPECARENRLILAKKTVVGIKKYCYNTDMLCDDERCYCPNE